MKHLNFRSGVDTRPLQPEPALEAVDVSSLIEQLTKPPVIQLRPAKSAEPVGLESILDAGELSAALEQLQEMLAIESQAATYAKHGCSPADAAALKYRLQAVYTPEQSVALEALEEFTPQIALEGIFDGIKEWWNKRREESQHREAAQATSIESAKKVYSSLLKDLRSALADVTKSDKQQSDDVRLDNLTQYFCGKDGQWPTDLHGTLQKGLTRAADEVGWLVRDQEVAAKIVHGITRSVDVASDKAFEATYIYLAKDFPKYWKAVHWKPNDPHHFFGPFMSEMEGKGCFYMKEKDILVWMRAAVEDRHNPVYFLSKLSDRTKAFEHHQTYSRQEALRLIELGISAVEHVLEDGIETWAQMCRESSSIFNRDQYILYGLQHGVDVIANKKITMGLEKYDAYVKSAEMQNPALVHNRIFQTYLNAIGVSERMARAVGHLGVRIAKQF